MIILKIRLTFLVLALCLLATVSCVQTQRPSSLTRPLKSENYCVGCNVILVSADSVRADRLSIYGYPRPTTPAITEFSKQSVAFKNFFVAGTLTPTSEASVHTGRYPVSNGMVGFQSKISTDSLTLAEVFKKNGYSTSAFSSSPEFFSRPNMRETFSRGYDKYAMQWRLTEKSRNLRLNEFAEWAAKQKKAEKPFFSWIALGTAHWPIGTHAPRKFNDPNYSGIFKNIDRIESSALQHAVFQLIYDGFLYNRQGRDVFIGRFDGTAGDSEQNVIEKQSTWPFDIPSKVKRVKLNPADIRHISDLYDNSIFAMDQEFSTLLKIVRELDLEKNTVIIFQSEHGEEMLEQGEYAHDNLWDTTIHAPLIIHSPTFSKHAGTWVEGLASGVDLAPTIYRHLGFNLGNEIRFDGVELLEKGSHGKFKSERTEVFLTQVPIWETLWSIRGDEWLLDGLRKANASMNFRNYGVRTATHKLIHRKTRFIKAIHSMRNYFTGENQIEDEYEFFDLRKDPEEKFNLMRAPLSAENKVELEALKTKLKEFDERMLRLSRLKDGTKDFQEYF